jgi:hypothetical protein
MIRIAIHAILFVWALAVAVAPARADRQVIFSPLTDGPDFDEAMEFFSGYLDPEEYNTEIKLKGTGGGWKLGNTLDLYLREFVVLGKGDVDDDGIDERFYILNDPGWCGSRGCKFLVVQKRADKWNVLCATSGDDQFVWISDWMDKSGYREMRASFRIYWHGNECYDDDPELLEEFRHKPELYPPPPTERIWKPMR